MWISRFLTPGSDLLGDVEMVGLQETVLSKCEAYLRHEGLLRTIAGTAGASRDLKEIATGLLSILNGNDDVALVKLLGAIISSIEHREGKITVRFKIPLNPAGEGDHVEPGN